MGTVALTIVDTTFKSVAVSSDKAKLESLVLADAFLFFENYHLEIVSMQVTRTEAFRRGSLLKQPVWKAEAIVREQRGFETEQTVNSVLVDVFGPDEAH